MRSDRSERRVVGVVAALAAGICVYAIRQVDPDLYGYLAYGRFFAERGVHVRADPFAYTSAGSEWIAFEYLSQLALWWTFHHFGAAGLIGLKCVLGAGAAFFLWRAVRATTDDFVVVLPAFLLCVSPLSRYFLFRPQLVTFLCFALFVAVLFRFLIQGSATLWVLPLVMLLWANAHGGFLAGLGAIALAIAARAAANLNRRPSTLGALVDGTRPLLFTLAACLAVTFINPWGTGLWRYVLSELSHGTNRRYIAEWGPGWASDPWSMVAVCAISATLAGVGWLATDGHRLVAGLRPWQWLATAAPLIAMAFTSVRHVPIAAIWAAPVIAILAAAACASATPSIFRRLWAPVAIVALIPIVVTAQYVAGNPRPVIATGRTLLGATNPCRAVAAMRANGLRGNVYNPLWWGSYLTWELYPAVRVSMDGRNISAFPREMVFENLRFYSRDAGSGDLEVPFRYNTDYLLLPSSASVLTSVRSDKRWREIYTDEDAVLFGRADASHATVLAPRPNTCPEVLEREP